MEQADSLTEELAATVASEVHRLDVVIFNLITRIEELEHKNKELERTIERLDK